MNGRCISLAAGSAEIDCFIAYLPMIATFSDLILRVALAIFLSHTALQSAGIWCAWPVGWIIATMLSLLFYREEFLQRKSSSS